MPKYFAALAVAVALVLFWAQQKSMPEKTVIAVLSHASVADPALDGVKSYLTKSGYIEGENIVYHYGGATGSIDALSGEADRLAALSPHIFLALSTPATLAAQKVARAHNIPVVFAPNSDPVGAGIVNSLQEPGHNTTGITFGPQEGKRLKWLTRLVPDAKRICFPYNPQDKSPRLALQRLSKLQESLDIEISPRKVEKQTEMSSIIPDLCAKTDAIYIPTDALLASYLPQFMEAARRQGIALSIPHRKGVEAGALTSYGFDLFDLGKQAGRLIQLILNGADAGKLPVETAEFKLAINMKVAKQLNLTISDSILRQAIRIDQAAHE